MEDVSANLQLLYTQWMKEHVRMLIHVCNVNTYECCICLSVCLQ